METRPTRFALAAWAAAVVFFLWFPLVFPGIVAASIFTFSLTLGDYITPTLVGKSLFIGNAIYLQVSGLAGNLPFAATLTLIPIAIMVIYLSVARKLGAFEAL